MNAPQKHKHDLYNIAFSAFFVALLAAQIVTLWQWAPVIRLELTDFILLTLAIFRLTRLFVYDGITAWFRDLFLDVKIEHGQVTRTKYPYGLQRGVSDIFSCPWCFRIWGGSTFVWLYLLHPTIMMYVALLLALSAVATVLQIATNLLGWKAEHQKMIVERES